LRERGDYRLTAEIYVPRGARTFPVMLYMHGGAYCVWSARDVRRIAVPIAASGYVVVNLNYGLAPEHPCPYGVEDAVYAARWATLNGPRYGGAAGPICVGGDSAGATLACAAISYLADDSQASLDEGDLAGIYPRFSAAFLHCGGFDFRARMFERDTTPGTTEVMVCLAYLGTHFLARQLEPLVSPYYASNLSSMPATYLSCGADDPLLPQTLSMTQRLADAGVAVTASIVPGLDHEFLLYDPDLPVVAEEWARMLRWLQRSTRTDDS
jgi:acetyl esterase